MKHFPFSASLGAISRARELEQTAQELRRQALSRMEARILTAVERAAAHNQPGMRALLLVFKRNRLVYAREDNGYLYWTLGFRPGSAIDEYTFKLPLSFFELPPRQLSPS